MYLLPLIPFGILIRSMQQKTIKKKVLHTEAALDVWFYTLQISTDCYWLETLRLVIVTETEPFPHGIQLAICNPLVVFTGADLQMFGSRNQDMDVNTEKKPLIGRRSGFVQSSLVLLLHVTVCGVRVLVVRMWRRITFICNVPKPTCCREELAGCQQWRADCWTCPLQCPNASLWGWTLLPRSLCASGGVSDICCAVSWNTATFRRHNLESLSGQSKKKPSAWQLWLLLMLTLSLVFFFFSLTSNTEIPSIKSPKDSLTFLCVWTDGSQLKTMCGRSIFKKKKKKTLIPTQFTP